MRDVDKALQRQMDWVDCCQAMKDGKALAEALTYLGVLCLMSMDTANGDYSSDEGVCV
jgi:hypothetical protein